MEAPQKPENNSKEEPGFEDLSVKEVQELDARPKFDRPCDITLVVSDGKEFKAHRDVLVESSPFFEKLLNTDMKETRKGVIRLEILSDSVMEDILEFIYTGAVEILPQQNAQQLIASAD